MTSSSAHSSQEDWPARARALLRQLQPDVALEKPVPADGPIMVVGAAGSGKTELIAALAEEASEFKLQEIHESAVTSSAMVGATAALVVLDGGAPMDKTDIAVVRAMAIRVHHVIFALTKIDSYEDWRSTRARDLQVLESLGPRFSSVVLHPVSARLHHLAMDAHDPLQIRQWSAASGLRPLVDALRRVYAMNVKTRTYQNWLRYLDGQLYLAGLRSQDSAEAQEADLTAEHRQLLQERRYEHRNQDAGRTERRDLLHSQLQLARVDLAVELNSSARSLSAQLRETVSKASGAQLKNVTELVKPKVLELDQRVVGFVHDRLVALYSKVVGDLDSRAPAAHTQMGLLPPEHLEAPQFGSWGLEDVIVVLLGVSAGVGLGKVVVLPFEQVPWLAAWSMPLVSVLGLVVAIAIVYVRRLSSGRHRAVAWAAEAVAYRRGQLEQVCTAELFRVEADLTGVLDSVSARQRRQSELRMDELEQQAKDVAVQISRLRSQQARDREDIYIVRKGLVALVNAADQRG